MQELRMHRILLIDDDAQLGPPLAVYFQRFELELVQDRGWTSWNRTFKGSAWFDVSDSLAEGSGIAPKAIISLAMTSDNEQQPVPRIEVELIPGGEILPGRELPEFCTQ